MLHNATSPIEECYLEYLNKKSCAPDFSPMRNSCEFML
ncbi:hypothetical protein PORCRE_316 [Porphyromonas crevioricanis JCM 15906]|uniref:Uncharacterized protein n=1 Tax=Porphyromonas crevioricanis JCM 15906 TaxID=1305617 RepID=T1CG42_9PORP|nr:hypothetical protein PORCRE_316 [Porphyromonas crevioricanis JCM 15906]